MYIYIYIYLYVCVCVYMFCVFLNSNTIAVRLNRRWVIRQAAFPRDDRDRDIILCGFSVRLRLFCVFRPTDASLMSK